MPENWETKTLGEIANIRGETVHPRDAIGLKYVGLEHISSGAVLIDCWGDPTKVKSTKNRFYPNDILYGKLRPYLDKVVLTKDGGIASTDILVITSNKADPSFLVHLLHTNRFLNYAKSTMSGVNHPRTSWSALSKFQFECPPLQEQCAIAQAGGAVQEAKAARQREIELERERKAALLQHIFSHGTRNESKQKSAVGDIPQSWKVAKLEDIATLHRGKDLPVQNRVAGSIPVIGSNGVTDWHNESPKDVPIPGVCTGRSGSIGLLTYVDRPYWPLNTALYVSDFHGNDSLFIYYWLQLFNFKKYSQGVSVPTLNRNLVHPVPVPLPPVSQQTEIANLLKACDEKITALERETRLIDELFKTVLELLMTNRLSSKPLIAVGAI